MADLRVMTGQQKSKICIHSVLTSNLILILIYVVKKTLVVAGEAVVVLDS